MAECPKGIEILELKSVYNEFPNFALEEPDSKTEKNKHELEYLFKDKETSKKLYIALHKSLTSINKEIWSKVAQGGITYYSPERVFCLVIIQKQGLRLHLFTGGKKIQLVEPIADEDQKYGQKWGYFHIKDKKDVSKAKILLKHSLKFIQTAIKNNENTGWYASTIKDLEKEAKSLGKDLHKMKS